MLDNDDSIYTPMLAVRTAGVHKGKIIPKEIRSATFSCEFG